jgi:hypothetical protein
MSKAEAAAAAARAVYAEAEFQLEREVHDELSRTLKTASPVEMMDRILQERSALLPRLHRDWAHPCLICTGTGLRMSRECSP